MDVTFRVRVEQLHACYGLDGGGEWGLDLRGFIETSNLGYFHEGKPVDMGIHESVDAESHGVYIGSTFVGINDEASAEQIMRALDHVAEHHAHPGSTLFIDIRSDRPLGSSERNSRWGMDGYEIFLLKASS